jgi:peptidoglycan/LPS O-acetylase OafA/YrhL
MQYRQEIDGLRAIAVSAVILNHIEGDLLPSGFLGVDIFFVISGYVITASLQRTEVGSLKDFLLNFYSRRIKRLVPALVVFVALTSVVLSLFDPAPQTQLKTGLLSLFGLSNLYLIMIKADYFGDSVILNSFTPTWSLGVEEQFYLVFPILVWLLHAKDQSRDSTRLATLLAVLAIVSLAFFVGLYESRPDVVYYSMPTRFWELAVGALTFFAADRCNIGWADRWCGVTSTIAFFGIAVVLCLPENLIVLNAILIVLLCALLIFFAKPNTLPHKILSTKLIVYIGLISYSLYLWHWPVLTVSRWTIGVTWYTVPFQLTLMLILASVSYRYLERPLRRISWSASRVITIGYGVASSVAVGMFTILLMIPLQGKLFTGERPNLVAAGVSTLTAPYSVEGVSGTWSGEECILSDNRDVGKNIHVPNCTLGDFGIVKNRVLVIGNSFSAAFTQSFDKLVRYDDYAVIITSTWGASVVSTIENKTKWNEANNYYWDTIIPLLSNKLRQGDWVFMINDMAGFSPEKSSSSSQERLALLVQGLKHIAASLAEKGIRLAVLNGLPFTRDANCDPASAISQWYAPFGSPGCKFYSREETLDRRRKLSDELFSLEHSGILHVVDLLNVFCDKLVCDYETSDGVVLYRDVWSHPSVEAARLSSEAIRKVLTTPFRDDFRGVATLRDQSVSR